MYYALINKNVFEQMDVNVQSIVMFILLINKCEKPRKRCYQKVRRIE